MNQPYARVNQPYATLTLASALREMFGVQLYKNNACALLSRILSILNLDWLQHARSVRGVYEWYSCTKPVTCSKGLKVPFAVMVTYFLLRRGRGRGNHDPGIIIMLTVVWNDYLLIFSQKCHILFHKNVGNSLQIIKYINLSRFQHILKL